MRLWLHDAHIYCLARATHVCDGVIASTLFARLLGRARGCDMCAACIMHVCASPDFSCGLGWGKGEGVASGTAVRCQLSCIWYSLAMWPIVQRRDVVRLFT